MKTTNKQEIRTEIARILSKESRQSTLKARVYGEYASRLIRKIHVTDKS